MPGITLTLSGKTDPTETARLADAVAALTCRVLRKELERTTVIVRHVAREDWFIVGQSLAALDRNAFRLEVAITDETNTREEKAAFHREAFALLSERIGNLHPHSNIHIIDCRATAYGYGGVTQAEFAFRRMAGA
jgi:4-oxalocrotonate tautomerase